MNSNSTQTSTGRTTGSRRSHVEVEAIEPPVRPWLVTLILSAGLLTITIGVFLAFSGRSPKSPRSGGESKTAQAEGLIPQAPSEKAPPASTDVANAPAAPFISTIVDTRGQVASPGIESSLSIPEHWGIEITKVGMTAGGKALDLRYKVLDVAKATSMLHMTNYVYVFNQSNHKVLIVPFQRDNQTSQKLMAGKTYFTLLPNKDGNVSSGNTVTVVVGGSRAENLIVY